MDEGKAKAFNGMLTEISHFRKSEENYLTNLNKDVNVSNMVEVLEIMRNRTSRALTMLQAILWVDDFVNFHVPIRSLYPRDRVSLLQRHIGKIQANELLSSMVNLVFNDGLSWAFVYAGDQDLLKFNEPTLIKRKINNLKKLHSLLNKENEQISIHLVFLNYPISKELSDWLLNNGVYVHDSVEFL